MEISSEARLIKMIYLHKHRVFIPIISADVHGTVQPLHNSPHRPACPSLQMQRHYVLLYLYKIHTFMEDSFTSSEVLDGDSCYMSMPKKACVTCRGVDNK